VFLYANKISQKEMKTIPFLQHKNNEKLIKNKKLIKGIKLLKVKYLYTENYQILKTFYKAK
jgi:hypothetical protein